MNTFSRIYTSYNSTLTSLIVPSLEKDQVISLFLQIVSHMHHKCQTKTPKNHNKSIEHITIHFEEPGQTFSQLSDV